MKPSNWNFKTLTLFSSFIAIKDALPSVMAIWPMTSTFMTMFSGLKTSFLGFMAIFLVVIALFFGPVTFCSVALYTLLNKFLYRLCYDDYSIKDLENLNFFFPF